MELREIIETLCNVCAPSGFEEDAVSCASELLRPLVSELKTDAMGNLIAVRRCGKDNAPLIMAEAHIDEIGLIVTGYEKGFLRFANVGGVDPRMLPAMEVTVLSNPPVFGVVDVLPPHVLSESEREKPLPADKLFIDVGLTQEEAEERIPRGTPVSFGTRCSRLGRHRLCGKSMDDRSCAAIVIRALELAGTQELSADVAILLAVQEEVGCRGAITGAFNAAPEAAVAVDVTFGDSPDAPKNKTFTLCKGPTIGVGPNMTRRISDRLAELVQEKNIPYQTEVLPGQSGTDAWPIQVSREGVATGLLSLPLKYMHTPVEVMDLRDAEATAALLAAWLVDYGKEDEPHA